MIELSLDGFRGRVERDYPLARATTYRLGGPAAILVEPADVGDLEIVARALRDRPRPVLSVGRGSNIVVSDGGFDGVVVHLGAAFERIEAGSGHGRLTAGAATPLPLLANWAARRGLAGLEFTVGIPGAIGGGVRMNAGAHGAEIANHLVGAQVFDLLGGGLSDRSLEDLEMDYRYSSLSDHEVVVAASFELPAEKPAAIKARTESYRRHRAATQPGAAQNAGSVFKNPPGDHAGRLVDAAGLKGFSVGGAAVSELHANFFMAGRGASAQDVYDLVHAVQRRVEDACGVVLEPEIRFVGSFAPAPEAAA